jgi:5,10-methylenetetrahydrofolate reductase
MDRVIFEIITPPETWAPQKIEEWAQRVCEILTRHSLRRLNIPEVVNESRDGDRRVRYIPKMDNVAFARVLAKTCPNALPVLNKISVRIPRPEFERWVEKVYEQGVRHLIIVGGELPDYPYPGYSVTDAASWIKSSFKDMKVGGITIFTRPHEAERIAAKMNSGIDFFVSQIIYETANLKHVLIELDKILPGGSSERFPDIYVSLAPAARIRDIEFMMWLGVEIPSAILAYLAKDDEEVEERTFEINMRVQEEIFEFISKKGYRLGFNVEHVIYTNLGLSERLLEEITERMGR